MKDAHKIYWFLFWGLSIDYSNQKVDEAFRVGNFDEVTFYCKCIAIKDSGISLEDFWTKYIKK
jgi:hypothetical protein